jgi:hypothetical protein
MKRYHLLNDKRIKEAIAKIHGEPWYMSLLREVEQLEQERDTYKELFGKCQKCLENELDRSVREKIARDGMRACVEGAVQERDVWKKALEMYANEPVAVQHWYEQAKQALEKE